MAEVEKRASHKVCRIKEVFLKYDTNGDGSITKGELCGVLKSLGAFKDAEINAVFQVLDANGDGKVQFNEFVDWVTGSDTQGYRARAALAPATGDDVELSFAMFCEAHTAELDCRNFTKLCKDAGFMDKHLTSVDLDLIFSKVLPRGRRKIEFSQFQVALGMIADSTGRSLQEVKRCVVDIARPAFHGTHPGAVHLHDDKTVARRAAEALPAAPKGRRMSPAPLPGQGEELLQRSRSGSKGPAGEEDHDVVRSARKRSTAPAVPTLPPVVHSGSRTYKEVFRAFCSNQVDLDPKGFAKLCRDCRLLDERFVAADADLLFTKVIDKGSRRMHISAFEEALYVIAQRRGMEYSQILEAVSSSHGPTMRATHAELPHFSARGGKA